jgi:hypothetical protein
MTEPQQHPSSPPQELRVKWRKEAPWDYPDYIQTDDLSDYLIAQAAQWAWDQREPEIQAAADAELEACLHHLRTEWYPQAVIDDLRVARRPEPPSLKAQALEQLGCIQTDLNKFGMGISTETIRRAIEALPDG